MLSAENEKLFLKISQEVKQNELTTHTGLTFFSVPQEVVNALKSHGFNVTYKNPLSIPDIQNGKLLNIIYVEYK